MDCFWCLFWAPRDAYDVPGAFLIEPCAYTPPHTKLT
jgi:hypothetical protein